MIGDQSPFNRLWGRNKDGHIAFDHGLTGKSVSGFDVCRRKPQNAAPAHRTRFDLDGASVPLEGTDLTLEFQVGLDLELTAKVARRTFRIYELGFTYFGRTYQEGKKIGLRDAMKVFYSILRYWICD